MGALRIALVADRVQLRCTVTAQKREQRDEQSHAVQRTSRPASPAPANAADRSTTANATIAGTSHFSSGISFGNRTPM